MLQLDFEQPLYEIEEQIKNLESRSRQDGQELDDEIATLRENHSAILKKIYANLSPVQEVQVARCPTRPYTSDYLDLIVKDFCELHGDRLYGDDRAIATGFGRIGPHKCMIVGHRKGKTTEARIACNFGMAHPEGYRKAMLKMKLAEKYKLPVVCLIDTPGAYPGIGAEERGQAEAIAYNLREMSTLRVPIVCIVIGEGGSGGALGIGVGDRIAMLEHSWYSVISPEGCAAILWKTGEQAPAAAEQLHLTAKDNLKLGTIDDIIPEPLGGAHRNHAETARNVESWIVQNLRELKRYKVDNLIKRRYEKFRNMGQFVRE